MKKFLKTTRKLGFNEAFRFSFMNFKLHSHEFIIETEFGKIIFEVTRKRIIKPFEHVFVCSQENCPMTEFVKENIQTGFDFHIQLFITGDSDYNRVENIFLIKYAITLLYMKYIFNISNLNHYRDTDINMMMAAYCYCLDTILDELMYQDFVSQDKIIKFIVNRSVTLINRGRYRDLLNNQIILLEENIRVKLNKFIGNHLTIYQIESIDNNYMSRLINLCFHIHKISLKNVNNIFTKDEYEKLANKKEITTDAEFIVSICNFLLKNLKNLN